MSRQLQTQIKVPQPPSLTAVRIGLLQRKCACGQRTSGGECEECKKREAGTLQRAAVNTTPTSSVPSIVHDVLSSPGQPLDRETRSFMEPRFGHDFSGVRVHTDAKADQSARAVNALAYTVGRDVVFGTGQYTPGTMGGKRLLAHELTHVVQQSSSRNVSDQLTVGSPQGHAEYEADGVAKVITQGQSLEAKPAASVGTLVQRDLARPPRGAPAPLAALKPEAIQSAIQFNQTRFSDPYSIRVIRDVVGISPFPAIVDEELVQAIVQWQSERRLTQDGKIGHLTTQSIFLELVAESQFRDAVFLLMDSYALPNTPQLDRVRVGAGADCCTDAGNPADAVTTGGTNARPINICVCQTSIPRNPGGYDHFIRILGHELIHATQPVAPLMNDDVAEFEAFFFEACSGGRAPQLQPAERVDHANTALGHFNNVPFPLRTPALLARVAQLNHLIAAGGVGPC